MIKIYIRGITNEAIIVFINGSAVFILCMMWRERMEKTIRYYENYNEDIRLERDNAHRVEFITTTHILDNMIDKNSAILDVGAGTGKYSFYYADKGHTVMAVDLSPKNVQIMKEKLSKSNSNKKINILSGNVLSLDHLEDESYDAVLCMGPLYHLDSHNERLKCIENCMKKLKKNGILAIAYINKFAVCLSEIRRDKSILFGDRIENILNNGAQFGDSRDVFYFLSPIEIENIMSSFNINKLCNAATDGLAYMMGNILNNFTEDEFKAWINFHISTCMEESLLGSSLHGLYVCSKK